MGADPFKPVTTADRWAKGLFRGGPLDGQRHNVPEHGPAFIRYHDAAALHWYVIRRGTKRTYQHAGTAKPESRRREPPPPKRIRRPGGAPSQQDLALRLQLAAVAGNEPASSFIEIRVFDRDMAPVAELREFIPVRELAHAAERVPVLADGFNVYVGCAPRVRRSGKAEAVERAWCLWADCDGSESVERLRRFRPLPSLVVRSGSEDHVHAYWQVSPPVPAVNVRRANRRLAHALGADRAACDAARVLRPIGSRNHKSDQPRFVECLRCELDVFEATDLVGWLPDDPREVPRDPRARCRRHVRRIDGLVRTVKEAHKGNRNNALNWSAYCAGRECPPDQHEAAKDQLREAALNAGLGRDEIERTLRSGFAA